MCAAAISLARFRRLYFGAYDSKGGGVEHGPKIFQHASCNHRPEIIGGMNEKESGKLLTSFFDNEPSNVSEVSTRFSGPVTPGNTLQINAWNEDSYIIAEVTEKETEKVVLKDFLMKKNKT